jgi:hypothetical protein
MSILVLKLILAPVIIGSVSLAGRYWGTSISGWLVGLPLTSGPVIFILAISHDTAFAFNSVNGVLSGGFSLIAYSLTYSWMSRRFNWIPSFTASVLIFAGMTTLLQDVTIPFIPLFFCILAVILVGLRFLPQSKMIESTSAPGRWDIPSRILIGTGFILLITWIAPYIGARLTGLLATIPLYISILTIFAHRQHGSAGAIGVLRGLVYGMFGFAGFYLLLGLLIEKTSLAVSFGSATLVAVTVQGVTLLILRKTEKQFQLF